MFDFFKAAFPWIVTGIATALFIAYHVRGKKNASKSRKSGDDINKGSYISEGMCIGMSFGVMFGSTGMCELSTGISLGLLAGMVIGMCIKK